MKSAAIAQEVTQSQEVLASESFGIDDAHAAHIMGLLRETIYTRIILAVLREYSVNAWDEHAMSGKGDVPIQVQLPTHMEPTLKIRDFGRGLSPTQVLQVYTRYGASTKRDTNDAAGMLGIGSKSGFAYSDQFTIISRYGGTKSVYTAVLDASNRGRMDLIHESPCGDDTGIEIQIAVRPNDIEEFTREAKALFRYFRPQPKINLNLPELPPGLEQGFILRGQGPWVAVMGCVPYRLDLNKIRVDLMHAGLWDCLLNVSGGVYLPMGSVEFAASREELRYTKVTVDAVVEALRNLVDAYLQDALKALTDPNIKGMELRAKATFLARVLKFPVPRELRGLSEEKVSLWDRENLTPKTFTLVDHQHTAITKINVQQGARILLLDDRIRKPAGWSFNQNFDVLALPVGNSTVEEMRAEIEVLVEKAQLGGINIGLMSQHGMWIAPYKHGRKQYPPNAKHRSRCFTLNAGFQNHDTKSTQWTTAEPPEEEHIYVVIERFDPQGSSLYDMFTQRNLLRDFGVEWPTIYGYKSTREAPVLPEDVELGVPFATWYKQTLEGLLDSTAQAKLRSIEWQAVFSFMPSMYSRDSVYRDHDGLENIQVNFRKSLDALIESLEKDLGPGHPVTRYFAKVVESSKEAAKLLPSEKDRLQRLALTLNYHPKMGPKVWLRKLSEQYRMFAMIFKSDQDLGAFHPKLHYNTLVSYILNVDKLAGGSTSFPEA